MNSQFGANRPGKGAADSSMLTAIRRNQATVQGYKTTKGNKNTPYSYIFPNVYARILGSSTNQALINSS